MQLKNFGQRESTRRSHSIGSDVIRLTKHRFFRNLFIVLAKVPLVRHVGSQFPDDHHTIEHRFLVQRPISLLDHIQQRQSLRVEKVIFIILKPCHYFRKGHIQFSPEALRLVSCEA